MAKYLLLKHYRGAPASVNDVPMDQWTPEEPVGPRAVHAGLRRSARGQRRVRRQSGALPGGHVRPLRRRGAAAGHRRPLRGD